MKLILCLLFYPYKCICGSDMFGVWCVRVIASGELSTSEKGDLLKDSLSNVTEVTYSLLELKKQDLISGVGEGLLGRAYSTLESDTRLRPSWASSKTKGVYRIEAEREVKERGFNILSSGTEIKSLGKLRMWVDRWRCFSAIVKMHERTNRRVSARTHSLWQHFSGNCSKIHNNPEVLWNLKSNLKSMAALVIVVPFSRCRNFPNPIYKVGCFGGIIIYIYIYIYV